MSNEIKVGDIIAVRGPKNQGHWLIDGFIGNCNNEVWTSTVKEIRGDTAIFWLGREHPVADCVKYEKKVTT